MRSWTSPRYRRQFAANAKRAKRGSAVTARLHDRLTRRKHCSRRRPAARTSVFGYWSKRRPAFMFCAANTGKDESNGHIQRVLLLQLKESNRLWKTERIVEGVQQLPGDWRDRRRRCCGSKLLLTTAGDGRPSQWQVPAPESWNDLPSWGINSHWYLPGESVSFSTPNAPR